MEVSRPSLPPPKFKFYRSEIDAGTAVVVSPRTTDEQLKSLLWFFREKVRSRRFVDIGITRPTSVQWGKKGYFDGMIMVYRGGPDEHSAAYYQWGLWVGKDYNMDHDVGRIRAADGNEVEIFNYKDGWKVPSAK